MRMEITDFAAVVFNPVAQVKFVHTVSAGYVAGAMFVPSISAWYPLRGRNVEIAKRSMVVASFGLASALSVAVLGDEIGYTASENQKMKVAVIEAERRTHRRGVDASVLAAASDSAVAADAGARHAVGAQPLRPRRWARSTCGARCRFRRAREAAATNR